MQKKQLTLNSTFIHDFQQTLNRRELSEPETELYWKPKVILYSIVDCFPPEWRTKQEYLLLPLAFNMESYTGK